MTMSAVGAVQMVMMSSVFAKRTDIMPPYIENFC